MPHKNLVLSLVALVLAGILIAFGYSTYQYYLAIHADDPIHAYVAIEQWDGSVIRGTLAIDMTAGESYDLLEGDTVMTRAASVAVVHWPDHSITRLGDNSKLVIQAMRVSMDYSHIDLRASLEQGKIWSNMVRTLEPGSKIEFRLPNQRTIAGVRGTVFEINLDSGYIHAVEHSVTLSNILWQTNALLPGDIVSASNIFQKLTSHVIDTTWDQLNTLRDTAYDLARSAEIQKRFDLLSGELHNGNPWDRFVRWILGFFWGFQDIGIAETIASLDPAVLARVPVDSVMRWYQSLQSKDFVQERDAIRGALLWAYQNAQNTDITTMLTQNALWDRLDFSGVTLKNTDALITTFATKSQTTLQGTLESIKSGDAEASARKALDALFQ